MAGGDRRGVLCYRFLLLNFVWAPSCGKFSCSYVPSWWPAASADSGSCPDAISGAMTVAGWAADRLETIAKKKLTAGLFYDPDGASHEFDSSQNDDSRLAYEGGKEIGVFDPRGPSFLVDHVEVKVAAAMRRGRGDGRRPGDQQNGRGHADATGTTRSTRSHACRWCRSCCRPVRDWWSGGPARAAHRPARRSSEARRDHADGGQVRRADLMHAADYPLLVTARFGVGSSEFTAHIADEDGLTCLLAAVARSPVATATVRLFLKPAGYQPAQPLPIEYPPSALYFDVDQQHQVAAAGLLVCTIDGASHQWRTRGDARVDGVVLVQDPHNPNYTPFPPEAFITIPQLHDAVFQWAFGETLPTPTVLWEPVSEWDVRWPIGSGYP